MKTQNHLPQFISLAQLAKICGVTRARIGQLVRAGVFQRAAHGRYPIEAITAYCAHLRHIAAGEGSGELTKQRVALIAEKVVIARMERRRLEGTLLPADKIEAIWVAIMTMIKTRLLAIAAKIAPHAFAAASVAQVYAVIHDEIIAVLTELSRVEAVPVDADRTGERSSPSDGDGGDGGVAA
jgi:phage terminase Nu1 subunit (DNA packaging protein)